MAARLNIFDIGVYTLDHVNRTRYNLNPFPNEVAGLQLQGEREDAARFNSTLPTVCPLSAHSYHQFSDIMNVPRWRESAVFKEMIDNMGEREAKRRK